MNKIPLEKLDINTYHETLASGLEVFVIKKENSNNAKASLFTKYGAEVEEFVPRDETKMRKFPTGIAHFLEHQMFNMEDGTKPFEVFGDNGANCNAFTNYEITNYYFNGVNNVMENIEYLLDYVGSPYFTKESVQKEKGIIVEEAKMYQNDVYNVMFDKLQECLYKVSPKRFPIIGTIKDINKTTNNDLMDCYKTFYHPSNMVLLVVGNVDAEEVIELAKKSKINQKHKNDKNYEIKKKKIVEPKEVAIEKAIIKFNVEIPKVIISYKINLDIFPKEDYEKLGRYISFVIKSKFGKTSLLNEKIIEDEIIKSELEVYDGVDDNFYFISFMAETNSYDEVIKRITNAMNNFTISEEDFNRCKKGLLSGYIDLGDNVRELSDYAMFEIDKHGTLSSNAYSKIKEYDYHELLNMIKKLSLRNKTIVITEKEDN